MRRRCRDHDVEFNATFILGGQIGAEPPRLFSVYAAGNFIEATADTPYFQIGESKYGKPIIDRVVTRSTSLAQAAKCALISMDSTIRSNLSVGLPLDLVCVKRDALAVLSHVNVDADHAVLPDDPQAMERVAAACVPCDARSGMAQAELKVAANDRAGNTGVCCHVSDIGPKAWHQGK